jgi:hypothetical protein
MLATVFIDGQRVLYMKIYTESQVVCAKIYKQFIAVVGKHDAR